ARSRDLAVALRRAARRRAGRAGRAGRVGGRRRRGRRRHVLVGQLVRPALTAPTVVGLVEPAALEDDPDRREDLAERLLPAVGALGQRVVLERLDRLQVLATAVASVLVGGHGNLGR